MSKKSKISPKFYVGQLCEASDGEGGWVPCKIHSLQDETDGSGYIIEVYRSQTCWVSQGELRLVKPPKGLTKREAMKLNPGTWVRVWLNDNESRPVLTIRDVRKENQVLTYDPVNGTHGLTSLDQIIEVIGTLEVPS